MENKDLLRIGLIALAGCVLLYFVNMYSNKNESFVDLENEEFENKDEEFENIEEFENNNNEPSPSESMGQNEIFSELETKDNESKENKYPKDCFPKDQLTPDELLPGDMNSKWAQVNPVGQGELGDQNFLNAGYHVGVNTVGQTLRNANLQIRSEPPNPQLKVSPWLQSTIEPDTNRKPMEIGGCE